MLLINGIIDRSFKKIIIVITNTDFIFVITFKFIYV